MKPFILLLFSVLSCTFLYSQTVNDTTKKHINSTVKGKPENQVNAAVPVVAGDSIARVYNLSSNEDSAKINDIIAIKLVTQKPISSFNTLYINGIKTGLKPWKEKACDA